MTTTFTLLPAVSKQVDSILPNSDVADLERALRPYIDGTNFHRVPTEHEFLAMAIRISQIISSMSWTRANPQNANSLVSFLISGIAATSGWPSYQVMLQKPGYKTAYSSGFTYFLALWSSGAFDGSIPQEPFGGAPASIGRGVKTLPTPPPVGVPVKASAPVRPTVALSGRGIKVPMPAPAPLNASLAKPGMLVRNRGGASTSAASSMASPPSRMRDPEEDEGQIPDPSSIGLYPNISEPSAPLQPSQRLDDQIQLSQVALPDAQLSALDAIFVATAPLSPDTPTEGKKKHRKGKEKEDIGN